MGFTEIDRRGVLAGGAMIGTAAIIGGSAEAQPALARTAAYAPQPLPLPFDPKAVPGLSERLLLSHHDNNYAGAVKRLNAISEELARLDVAAAPAFTMNGLKREEHIAYNSTVLHELYFECLGEAPTQPSGVFAQALARDFGSLDRWKAEFAATGKALGGGSGWVILAYAPRDKRLFTHWAADHSMAPAGGVPLLALDRYEHAYQMDYGADAGKYVDNFMQAIRWTTPERLYREAIRV